METNQEKLKELETGKIGKLLWEYSLPAVVGIVVMSLYNVIDRIFIGQGVGTEAIAGLAITFPVMNVATALGVLIGAGASARVSIMLGARDHAGAQKVLGNSLTLTLLIGTIYIMLFKIFLADILVAFGASEVTLPYAYEFMEYILPGLLFTNLAFNFNNIMRASGYPVRAMVTMFIGAGINVILAPVFIFGLDMGIKGAAIATDISMACSSVFVMAHFFRRDSIVRFTKGIYRLEWRIVVGIIGIGAAPSLVNFAGSTINAIVNLSLLHYGSDMAVAAVGIFTTYTSLLVMIVVGICQGMQPIVGYNYGAGKTDRLKGTYLLAVAWGSGVCAVGTAFGLTCPHLIARAFASDPELISTTSNAMRIGMAMFWAVGFQIVSTNLFQSIGKAGKSIFLSLTRQVLFLIPLLIMLPRHFGLDGIWMSFPVSDGIATLVTALLTWWQFRKILSASRRVDCKLP